MRSRTAAVLRRLAHRVDPLEVDPRATVTLDRAPYKVRAGLVVTSTTYSHGDRSLALEFGDQPPLNAESPRARADAAYRNMCETFREVYVGLGGDPKVAEQIVSR